MDTAYFASPVDRPVAFARDFDKRPFYRHDDLGTSAPRAAIDTALSERLYPCLSSVPAMPALTKP